MANDPDRYRQGEAQSEASVTAEFAARGFEGSFAPRSGGRVLCFTCREESDAATLHVEEERRLEGASDPADMMLLVATRCPACGTRGTLVLSYGPEAGTEDVDVMQALDGARGSGGS